MPTVCGGVGVGSNPEVVVDADNRAGGAAAVGHLLSIGRRRLAVLTGPQDMSSGRDRLDGARDALPLRGWTGRASSWPSVTTARTAVYARCVRCSTTGLIPDAVFAASDLMAVGALRVLREAGLRVPDDVALVGFDDSPVCRHTHPTLTSVHQPVEEMGRVMADLLLARIAGETVPPQTVLPTRLVVRASA